MFPCINNSSNLMDVIYKMYLKQKLLNITGGKRTHNNPWETSGQRKFLQWYSWKLIIIPIKSNVIYVYCKSSWFFHLEKDCSEGWMVAAIFRLFKSPEEEEFCIKINRNYSNLKADVFSSWNLYGEIILKWKILMYVLRIRDKYLGFKSNDKLFCQL